MAGQGGKRPGAGRKPKAVEGDQSTFINTYLTEDKRVALLEKMYEIAMGENLKAAVTAGSLLLAYSLGKPLERVQHGGEDGGPLEVVVRYVSKPPQD